MTTNKLKPCPFCGGEAELKDFGKEYSKYKIVCDTDGCVNYALSVTYLEKRLAIATWNKRAGEQNANRT